MLLVDDCSNYIWRCQRGILWFLDKRPISTAPDEKESTIASDIPPEDGRSKPVPAAPAQPAVAPGEWDVAISTTLSDKDVLEQQRLLEEHFSLQEQLKAMHAALNHEQAVAERARREEEAVREAWRCRICLDADIDTVLTVCGHALCFVCSVRCGQQCPFCCRNSPAIRLYQ